MSSSVIIVPLAAYLLGIPVAWYVARWATADRTDQQGAAAFWPFVLIWLAVAFIGRHIAVVWNQLKMIEKIDRLMWLLVKTEVPDSRYDKRPNDRLYMGRKPGLREPWKEIKTDSFTTGKRIYLPVPPEIVRVRQGLAWGFDIAEVDYDPDIAG